MKTQIILDPEDIQKIVAEKYKVDSDKVEVRCYMADVGYGMGERKEPTFEVMICSGVIIPDVEMPKNCHECDAYGLSDVVGLKCPCDASKELYSYDKRPEECPLQEITRLTPDEIRKRGI